MSAVEAVLLPVGDELYAVPMEWVREVVAAPPITMLATAPPVVLGLFNLRGQIVPLFDTAALLGIGSVDEAGRRSRRSCRLPTVWRGLPRRGSRNAPCSRPRPGPSELHGTIGVFRLGRRVAVLLDLAALLTPEGLGGRDRDVALPAGVGLMAALSVTQIRALFAQEAEGRLTRLSQLLLELEGAQQDEDLIRSVFREIHTLKGSSAVAGLDEVSRVAHELEGPVDDLRSGRRPVTPDVIDRLLAGVDRLSAAIAASLQDDGDRRRRLAARSWPQQSPTTKRTAASRC